MNIAPDYEIRGTVSKGWSFNSARLNDMHLEETLAVGRRLVERQHTGHPCIFKSPSTTRRAYQRNQDGLPNNLIPQALGLPPPSPSPMNHHPIIPRTPRELKRRIEKIRKSDKNFIQHSFVHPPTSPSQLPIFGSPRSTIPRVFENATKRMLNLKTVPKSLGCVMSPTPKMRNDRKIKNYKVGKELTTSNIDQRQNGDIVVKGLPASMGIAKGTVRIILQDEDFQKVKEGDILVMHSCASLALDTTLARNIISQCAGICTEVGGMLCQAAIVGREKSIPTVVGCHGATKKLQDGDFVIIDGSNATVKKER